jgi:AcrR family transcriptional regulator
MSTRCGDNPDEPTRERDQTTMTASEPPPRDEPLVWERPEPGSRAALEPLSRERIVRAAVAIADAEGLVNVSLRKVAAALDAGPMRLYGYLSTKEELLELMVDSVYAEMLAAAPVAGPWRAALRALALRLRATARAHHWFVDLMGGRPHIGPGGLAYLEALFATLEGAPGFEDIDAAMQSAFTLNAYVIGALRSEASELQAERESAMNEAQWQAATGAYMHRMIATGRFPNIARVMRDATHPSADAVFERGLDMVLDGLAAQFRVAAQGPG